MSALLLVAVRVVASSGDPLLAVATVSGAIATKEYHDPDGWWQKISYQCDLSLKLFGYFAGVEGSTEVYYLTKTEGTLRFRGTAEDHFVGSTEVFDFDDRRTFDLETPDGILRFSPAEQRVVYVGLPLPFAAAGGVRPYHLRIYGTNPPPSVRLYVDLPSKWWFGPEYDFSPAGVTPVVPDIEVLDARMVTPNELGVGIRVRYPSTQNAAAARCVLLEADINGTAVRKEIDVTAHTKPGEYWGRVGGQQNTMYDLNGNLLPTSPLRIDLSEFGVPRFDDNEEFDVTAIAYSGSGLSSVTGRATAKILLPVVMLHGYIHKMILGFPVEGYPWPWWAGGNLFPYELAYKSLKRYLAQAGYDNEDQWENFNQSKYRTYWDPFDFNYTDPPDATPDIIFSDVAELLQEVWQHNYARKVNIVAHSFGGLVARHYAANSPLDFNKIITVGTPHAGATFFYEVTFGFPSKAEADGKATVSSGPAAGRANALLWTVPRYPAIDLAAGGVLVPPPYQNTLTLSKGPGVRYYALYEAGYPDTLWKLDVQPTAGWYEVVNKPTASGDGYILASSASAFADASYRVKGPKHAFMLNEEATQAKILALLSSQSTGTTGGARGQSFFVKGRLLPSGSISKKLDMPSGVAEAVFELDWPGSTLNLRLSDPTGRVIDSGWASGSEGIQIEVGANYLRYVVPDPLAGAWDLEIIAVEVPPAGEEFLALAHFLNVDAGEEVGPLGIYRTGAEEITLAWPAGPSSILETTESLAVPNSWFPTSALPVVTNDVMTLRVAIGEGRKFYRLVGSGP
ncbi:MAG: alpha/beta fold hydrolase [Planctomycetes bacterium]|nr:alpha/beta fold hydrolase [Planctomycetota bacterium]